MRWLLHPVQSDCMPLGTPRQFSDKKIAFTFMSWPRNAGISPLALQYFLPKRETISSIKILSASWLMVHEYYKNLTHGIPLDLFEDYNIETNDTHPLMNWELCTLQQGRAKYVGVAKKSTTYIWSILFWKVMMRAKVQVSLPLKRKNSKRPAFLTNKSLISKLFLIFISKQKELPERVSFVQ